MPWLKLWVDILDDPDLDALPNETCWAWTRMLAVAKRNDPQGQLPPLRRLAVILREPAGVVERYVSELTESGMIDLVDGTMCIHNWHKFQTKEDTTNAERQARFKARRKSPSLDSPPEEIQEEKRREAPVTALVTPVTKSNAVTGVTSPPPSPPSASSKIGKLAGQLMGDVSWEIWADQQIQLGHPEHAIKEALEICVNKAVFDRRFAGGILRDMAQRGYPTPRPGGRGKGGKPTSPENQPLQHDPERLAQIEAELAKRPKITPEEFERSRGNVF